MNQVSVKDKLPKGKARVRKRPDLDDRDSRKSKRSRKDSLSSPLLPSAATASSSSSTTFAPLFPPTRPTPQHLPYYQSCINNHALPAEIIFPPLPPASAFTRVLYHRNEPSSATSSASSARATSPPQTLPSFSSSTPTSSASSVPGLTPNRRSSSSPSMPATSDMDLEANPIYSITESDPHLDDQDARPLSPTASTILKPVRFWGGQPNPTALQPSIHLLSSKHVISEDEDDLLKCKADSQRQNSLIQVYFSSATC